MEKHLEIKCPQCNITLIVDRITGQVLETREPLVTETTGDRFQDALKKVKSSPGEVEEKFEKSKKAERNKQKDLDDLFNKSMDQAKKEGPVGKQIKDIDLE